MISAADLRSIAQSRMDDARVLFANGRYDGAGYVCRYAIELALKARICDTLRWAGYPMTRGEFCDLTSFKTHNLDMLLRLSGREPDVKLHYLPDWSIVCSWNPEARYTVAGAISAATAQDFLTSTQTLLPLI